MSGQFIGYYENAIHNQRVIIPSAFKKKFSDEARNTVVVTRGPLNTIAIFPLDGWYAFLEKLNNGSEEEKDLRSELIYFAVTEQKLEGPGRIRLPELLLEEANITDKVVIKGEMHFMSLWNPDEFFAHRKAKTEEHRRRYTPRDYH